MSIFEHRLTMKIGSPLKKPTDEGISAGIYAGDGIDKKKYKTGIITFAATKVDRCMS